MKHVGRRSQLWHLSVVLLASAVWMPPHSSGQSGADALADSFRKAADRAWPAVVTVRTPERGRGPAPVVPPPGYFRPRRFVPPVLRRQLEGDDEIQGSGIVVDADHGYILTTDHLLMGSSQATVILADGRERAAGQIRRDSSVDLAVLVVDTKGLNLQAVRWGDSSALGAGDWVLVLGQSAAGEPLMLVGNLSGRRRVFAGGPQPAPELLAIGRSLNPVHSNGAVVNLKGEVVGICAARAEERSPSADIGYAIPADTARRFAGDLVAHGRVRRAYLGVQIDAAAVPGRDPGSVPGGVVVTSVTPATPAEAAGLRRGDRITSAQGRAVKSVAMLQGLVEFAPIGEELMLKVERDGKVVDVAVRPQEQPARPGFGPAGDVFDPLKPPAPPVAPRPL
jgi:serine protease Do